MARFPVWESHGTCVAGTGRRIIPGSLSFLAENEDLCSALYVAPVSTGTALPRKEAEASVQGAFSYRIAWAGITRRRAIRSSDGYREPKPSREERKAESQVGRGRLALKRPRWRQRRNHPQTRDGGSESTDAGLAGRSPSLG